ncbi:MAG: aminotransferase [Geminicoccaceae bacterium]
MPIAPNSLAARDIAYNVHPYTNLRVHEEKGPLVITGGEGIYVKDDDGKEYIEGLAGLWCTSLGFSNKRLVEAARRQMDAMPYSHQFAHRSTEPVIDLAEKLIGIAPKPLQKAFFVNSGSEAIDTAIKLIWYYNNARGKPEKKRIIARRRAYHGITVAAGHLTGLPYARAGFDLPMSDRFFHVTPPTHYREGLPGESEAAFTDRLAQEVETLIQALGPDTVAAFVAEPVQGAGGVIVPPADYFRKIQPILKKYDVLMVADEVICGFGRTGQMFGSNTFGIAPDLMTVAKQLSSAYLPIAGLLMREAFYDVLAEQTQKLGVLGMGYLWRPSGRGRGRPRDPPRSTRRTTWWAMSRPSPPRFMARLKQLGEHPWSARRAASASSARSRSSPGTRAQYPVAAKAAAAVATNLSGAGADPAPAAGRRGRHLPASDHHRARGGHALRPPRRGARRHAAGHAEGGLSILSGERAAGTGR